MLCTQIIQSISLGRARCPGNLREGTLENLLLLCLCYVSVDDFASHCDNFSGSFPAQISKIDLNLSTLFLLEITIETAGLCHPSGVCGSETDASGAATEVICTYMAIRGSSPSVEDFVTGVNCVSNSQSTTVVMLN